MIPHSGSTGAQGFVVGADGTSVARRWQLAEETPVAVLYNGAFFAVMMATPVDLDDFATGFTITEGIVAGTSEIQDIRSAETADGFALNIKIVPQRMAGIETRRRVLTGRSGCGICGAQTLDAAVARPRSVRGTVPATDAVVRALGEFPRHQIINAANHSTHAAALVSATGSILITREDVGRHNALDKLIGAALRTGLPLTEGFVMVSSRCSMELVQKAAMVGVPFLASVSAPTALAVRLAGEAGMGLAARDRDGIMVFGPPTHV